MKDLIHELQSKIAQLEEEVKFKNGLISILSHDSKELFGNFLWLVEALEQKTITEEMFLTLLQQVKSDARRNLKTVQNSTAWLKTQYGDFKIRPEKILADNLFLHLKEKFAKELIDKKLDFKFKGNKDIFLVTDHILLEYVLDKIVHNAIKYSTQGQEISFEVSTNDDSIVLTIADSGTGMTKEYAENIFSYESPIFTGTAGEKGVGLSLKIVRNFLSLLQGNIKILSSEGQGTTVSLSLPKIKE